MIVFQNPGLIELAAVTTMGVSVKETDSPIGYFGTGLKFAIATILRMGENVALHRGREVFMFTAERIEVRGQEFFQVCMNGQPLGFTTQLGKNWEPWMAFRELASNCRDEGGEYFRSDARDWDASDAVTTICVTGDDIASAYADRQSILLEGAPLFENEELAVYEGPSAYVYYRGVRIHHSQQRTAMLYNIKTPLDLTEDRTAKNVWQVHLRIEQSLPKIADETLLRRVLTCGQGYLEHQFDFDAYCHTPAPEFARVVNAISLGAEAEPCANPHAVKRARAKALEAMEPGDGMQMNVVQAAMFGKAIAMLTAAGHDVSAFPILTVRSLGANVHGLAKDGKIYIAGPAFDKGTRELAATILEEFAHLRSDQDDCTRGFQNWLLDQLLIAVEKSAGQPF